MGVNFDQITYFSSAFDRPSGLRAVTEVLLVPLSFEHMPDIAEYGGNLASCRLLNIIGEA